MPRQFYQSASGAQERDFHCTLINSRCLARNRNGRQQCARRSFRHPFCMLHTKEKLGVEVRSSRVHGCGLFALRVFEKGDVIIPYTGQTTDRARMVQTQHRNGSPYGVALAGGVWVDSSCLRGLGAYINSPTRSSGRTANVHMMQAQFNIPTDERLFLPEDPQTRLRLLSIPNNTMQIGSFG